MMHGYDPIAVRDGHAAPPDDPKQRRALRLAALMAELDGIETLRVLFVGSSMIIARVGGQDDDRLELDADDMDYIAERFEQHVRCYLSAAEFDRYMRD